MRGIEFRLRCAGGSAAIGSAFGQRPAAVAFQAVSGRDLIEQIADRRLGTRLASRHQGRPCQGVKARRGMSP